MENGAPALQLAAQRKSIRKISVVGKRHLSLVMVDKERLDISPAVHPGRTVTYMANGDISISQRAYLFPGEDFCNEPDIPARRKDTVVVDSDPGTFLAAVLQGIQRRVDDFGEASAIW